MKRLFLISAVCAFTSIVWAATAASPTDAADAADAGGKPLVVVELFTSQGCMACPPADKVLAELKHDENIVALSWPVDYWDYLGWRDTFATPENSKRQAKYNWAMGRKGVYTPQMVFNGHKQVVGSRIDEVRAMVEKLRGADAMPVEVSLDGSLSNLSVRLQGVAPAAETTVWLVMFDDEQVVEIHYGENRGRDLHYANIVRGTSSMGVYAGGDVTIPIDMAKVKELGVDCIAVIVQSGRSGPILGAVKTTLAALSQS